MYKREKTVAFVLRDMQIIITIISQAEMRSKKLERWNKLDGLFKVEWECASMADQDEAIRHVRHVTEVEWRLHETVHVRPLEVVVETVSLAGIVQIVQCRSKVFWFLVSRNCCPPSRFLVDIALYMSTAQLTKTKMPVDPPLKNERHHLQVRSGCR